MWALIVVVIMVAFGAYVLVEFRSRRLSEDQSDEFTDEVIARDYKKDTGVNYEAMISEASGMPDIEPKKKKTTKKKAVAKKRTAKKKAVKE